MKNKSTPITVKTTPVPFTVSLIVVFLISLISIALELFLTRILNLKAWNHVVYVIIPFAILGYGIGSNIYLIFREKIDKLASSLVISANLILLALLCLFTTIILIYLPIQLDSLQNYFKSFYSMLALLEAYTIILLPFVVIGFLITYIFSLNIQKSNLLYCWDLVGAGFGAILFFILIYNLEIFRSILVFIILLIALALWIKWPNKKWVIGLAVIFSIYLFSKVAEPIDYKIDETKGLNYIPGFLNKTEYDHLVSKWTPLGRTDAFRIKDKDARRRIYKELPGTFQINVKPNPEYSYFAANYLAGTPIYKLSEEGLKENNSTIDLFSEVMEFPYIFMKDPRVVIIGTGGGRDIFMAKTHQAQEVKGAEINPGFYREMMPGGKLHEYSGKTYTAPGVKVVNIDGRHLVKTLPANTYDLILLNGVDTYTGLSTGAYAYAESYLYTQNAIRDYLHVLNDNGMINFNRWFFPSMPRETMRLFVIALDALKAEGIEKPWDHIIIGQYAEWGMTLISKKPFTSKEVAMAEKYLESHGAKLVYPSMKWKQEGRNINIFMIYASALMEGQEQEIIKKYPFDISVVYDNNPFFYKYYRFKDLNPLKIATTSHPVTGTIVFFTQIMVLIHAVIFILIFIFVPLFLFKKQNMFLKTSAAKMHFIGFFTMLGLGFMFIEIPLMQKFALVLGSPIYSMSVVLSVLLISTGLGSFSLSRLKTKVTNQTKLLNIATVFVCSYIVIFILEQNHLFDVILQWTWLLRVSAVSLMIFPLGFALGMYFPSGLSLIDQQSRGLVAWAWGINNGFTVLGSILAILLAQFYGFNTILILAAASYVLAAFFFSRLSKLI